jgi:CheY-like chemotaxis protein
MAMPVVKSIPLLYHPTNVVFLDDDPKFLNVLSMNLDLTIPYVTDTDPQKVMHYLKRHTYEPDALSAMIIKRTYEDFKPGAPETFAVDFSALLATLTTPTRFKKSLHGMFDRAMKEVDGIAFCRSIREENIPIKIHLFTGKTSTDEAVELFNQKLIDGFLPKEKDVAKLAEKVNAIIREATWQQFVELGEKLSGLLSHVLKPLRDEQFINVFTREYEKYNTVEFYIVDSSCSFLLIDADGNVKLLFVTNEEEFKNSYEIAKDAKAPYEVLQAIRGRQMFPYTKEAMGYVSLNDEQWENAMVQMDKVPGRELYYAVIDRPDIEVYSFNRYMQEEWPQP